MCVLMSELSLIDFNRCNIFQLLRQTLLLLSKGCEFELARDLARVEVLPFFM